jgi:hypothetical protein
MTIRVGELASGWDIWETSKLKPTERLKSGMLAENENHLMDQPIPSHG